MLMLHDHERVLDFFAGIGGASLGLFQATGRSPDAAVNHWPVGIGIHAVNHGETEHFVEDVWNVSGKDLAAGRPVGILWASPDCTHFSKAKGGKPKSRKIRALAWRVYHLARECSPRVMIVENVEEFMTWGPLHRHLDDCPGDSDGNGCLKNCKYGQPIEEKAGTTYRRWFKRIERLGYRGAYRVLRAADYGSPTTRTRVFFVFRRDGIDPQFPEPTHGDAAMRAANPALLPWRAAAECIDFTIPCPSIFLTKEEVKAQGLKCKRPLAEPTLARVARSFHRHVAESASPFLVDAEGGQVAHVDLIQTGYGERKATDKCKAQKTRVLDIKAPLGTVVSCGVRHAVAAAFLVKNNGGHENSGQDMREPAAAITTRDSKSVAAVNLIKLRGTSTSAPADGPAPTITSGGTHLGTVAFKTVRESDLTEAQLAGARRVFHFLTKYNGTQQYPRIDAPAPTITTKEGLALVEVVCLRLADGDYVVWDIGFRMLTPRELARCQGFPDDYDIGEGRLSQEDQVRGIGNSVCPQVARALIEANVGSWTGHLKSKTTKGAQLDVTITRESATYAEAN